MSGTKYLRTPKHCPILTPQDLERKYRQSRLPRDLFDVLLHDSSSPSQDDTPMFNPELSETYTPSPLKEHKKEEGCRCSKIGCLKLYCQCFAKGRYCGQSCACSCCNNNSTHLSEVQAAREEATRRKHDFLSGSKGAGSRCKCKQSGCLKRYCQCFKAGVECGESCHCTGCENCFSIRGKSNPLQ